MCRAASYSRGDKCLQHSLQVEGRTTDDLEHVRGGGTLLKGFSQFIEEPRTFYLVHLFDRDEI
jgi:hypothetical protein